MMKFSGKILTIAFVLATSVSLSACSSTAPGQKERASKIETVMQRAAAEAKSQGNIQQSLEILEKLYKGQSNDPDAAMKYARALREEGYFNRASLVLAPFATDEDIENADLIIEYSALLAAMGNYTDSEEAARRTVLLAPESGKAYHVLGVALDAQGYHEQAQVAFERGLDYWEGDPSPILNNIGLNLAAQGFLDEAIETLRKALDTAPNRVEIERNLRIVSALQYQPPKRGTRLVPKPSKKPDAAAITTETTAEVIEVMEAVEVIEVEEEPAAE